jgi:predicted dehydrogenase
MSSPADLHRAVKATLASGRLGTPVFVRYHLQSQEGALKAQPLLAQATDAVEGWMGRPAARAQVLGAARGGHVCTLLEFRGGPTALVSWARGPARGTGVDLIVLGNRGALYHEAPGLLWEAALPSEDLDARDKGSRSRRGPYGILLVTGSHTHQETYATAFGADRRCRLVAVTDEAGVDDRRRALNEQLARALAVPYVVDLDKALSREDIQVVSVCAPPARRGPIAVRCAEAGKHLYLDKSLAPTVRQADAIAAAVKKAGVTSHMFSFIPQPWARQAKRLLASGRLGTLRAVHADVLFAKGRAGSARLGRRRREEFPPGRHQLAEAKRELDNVGVYPITLIRWLTGRRFQTVLGVTANYFFGEHQRHNVEDFGVLACTLEGDLPVTIAAGRCGWTSHPAGGVTRVMLVGSERTVVVDANRPRLEVYADEPPWTPPGAHPEDPMGFWDSTLAESGLRPKQTWVRAGGPAPTDAAYFLDCLDAGRDSEINAAEAALAAEVLVAAYRSAATRQVVTLPLPRQA